VVERTDTGLRAVLAERFALELEPVAPEADLGDVGVRVCRVRGEVAGRRVECLGTVSEVRRAPQWEQLELLRSVSALVDERHALLALAKRPRGALGHGQEEVAGWLLDDGALRRIEDARISTVYDGAGRQRSAGLELWLKDDEYAHRGSGAAVAGSSLELEGLSVHAAVFRWRLDGREAIGAYELMVRVEPPVAA
jgi:hypothetical protein